MWENFNFWNCLYSPFSSYDWWIWGIKENKANPISFVAPSLWQRGTLNKKSYLYITSRCRFKCVYYLEFRAHATNKEKKNFLLTCGSSFLTYTKCLDLAGCICLHLYAPFGCLHLLSRRTHWNNVFSSLSLSLLLRKKECCLFYINGSMALAVQMISI